MGLEAKAALRLWHEYSHARPEFRRTGERDFDSDLDLLQTIGHEEEGLYSFCRSRGLDGAALLAELRAKGAKKTAGSEHLVFLDVEERRVLKVTIGGKYGLPRKTLTQYLERLSLLNEIYPELDIRFEDCLLDDSGEYSILTSMALIKGSHPDDLAEVEKYLASRGFETFSDRSGMADYIHRKAA